MLREEGEVDELERASFYFTHSHGHGTSWTAVHLKEEALRATCDTSEPQEVPTSVVTLLVPPPFYAPLQHIRTQLSDNIRCGPHITLYSFFSFRLCFGSPRRTTLAVLTPNHNLVVTAWIRSCRWRASRRPPAGSELAWLRWSPSGSVWKRSATSNTRTCAPCGYGPWMRYHT